MEFAFKLLLNLLRSNTRSIESRRRKKFTDKRRNRWRNFCGKTYRGAYLIGRASDLDN
jgi:hypothetical protein